MKNALNDEEGMLHLYLNDITASKPLSREREVALAGRIQQGDLQARDELVQANLRFVVEVAKQFQNRGLPLCELISAGNLGLLTAAERFDGTRGFKFISYAVWWVRQSILQALAEQVRMVRLPLNRINLLGGISKASQRLSQGGERAPDVGEIAVEMGVSAEAVQDTLLSARTVCSLDKPFEKGDKSNLLSVLADINQESPDAEVLRDSVREQLEGMLKSLDERELRILRLYFGLDGGESITLEKIGVLMHLTRERVRQLKERALGKLRHPSRAPALRTLASEIHVSSAFRKPRGE